MKVRRPDSPTWSSSSPTCTATAAGSSSRPITRTDTGGHGIGDRSSRTTIRDRGAGPFAACTCRSRRPAGEAGPSHRRARSSTWRSTSGADRRPSGAGSAVTLSAENFTQCYLPPASPTASPWSATSREVEYKCTDFYDPRSEIGIALERSCARHPVARAAADRCRIAIGGSRCSRSVEGLPTSSLTSPSTDSRDSVDNATPVLLAMHGQLHLGCDFDAICAGTALAIRVGARSDYGRAP